MKTIGLIGGMSWESTRLYYEAINVEVRTRLGGLHSAKCIVHSARLRADRRDAGCGPVGGGRAGIGECGA